MMCLVERGADKVVHGGVGNDEGLFAVALYRENPGDESAGLGDKEAAGLDEQAAVEVGKRLLNGGMRTRLPWRQRRRRRRDNRCQGRPRRRQT